MLLIEVITHPMTETIKIHFAANRGDEAGRESPHSHVRRRDKSNIEPLDAYDPTPEELSRLQSMIDDEASRNIDLAGHGEFSGITARYLDEIGQVPLLSPEEEIELAMRIEKRKSALSMQSESEENPENIQTVIKDGLEAYQHLIAANTRYVVKVALTYMGRGLPFLDLVQEGNIGLMKAVNKFDYHRGYRLVTYAMWWIQQTITRAIEDSGRTIRVPSHVGRTLSRMRKIRYNFFQEHNRDATDEELAESIGISLFKLAQLKRIEIEPLSLDESTSTQGGQGLEYALINMIEDTSGASISENIDREQLRSIIDSIVSTAKNPRDQDIFRYRWCLSPYDDETVIPPRTLEATGNHYKVSKERIRQVDRKMINLIKAMFTRRRLWHDLR